MNAAVSRARLTPDELRQLRWLLGGVLSILGVATAGFMDVEAGPLMALAIGVAALTTARPQLIAGLPRFVHVLAFPVIAAFFAFDLWLRAELLPAMVRLDILLLLYRALVYRQRRDDLQVIVLGLFLVVVAGVLTVSLGFALQIFAYTAGSLLFLLVITLGDAHAGIVTGTEIPTDRGVPRWAAQVNWRRLLGRVVRVTDWRVMALGTLLFVGVIAGTALLFMVIPRFQLESGMFLDRFISKKARSGFSETITFGEVTAIQQDTSIALHIDVPDPRRIPASPYWRMLVLNEYADGTFRMSPQLRATRFAPARTGTAVYAQRWRGRGGGTWRFYLEPGVSRYLPLPARFQRLRFAEAQTYQHADELGLLAVIKDPVTMVAYQVDNFDLGGRLRDDPGPHYTTRNLLQPHGRGFGPADSAVIERILDAAIGAPATPLGAEEFSERLCAWLRQQHGYTLSPRIPSGPGDPVLRWADSRESGHCELFAGAFVVLARAAGYPARVVTGFRGGTWNAYSASFTVRNSDAHAWAEIYDHASRTWLRADPLELPTTTQPGSAAEAAALAERTDRSWTARLESLRVFWYRRIVSFDQQTQAQGFRAAKEATQGWLREMRQQLDEAARAVRAWFVRPWNWERWSGVLASALLAAAFAWAARRVGWSNWRWRWRVHGKRDDPVRREAGRWLVRLVSAASHRRDSAADVIPDLQRLRFGPSATWPKPADVFRRARAVAKHGR